MKTPRIPLTVLDQIDVRDPCPQPWSGMTGDDQKRFCDQCRKQVHHLSAMTAGEAVSLVTQAGENLCIRFRRDCDGRIITRDRKPSRRNWMTRVAALFAGAVGVAAGGCQENEQPGAIAGNMVWPEREPKEGTEQSTTPPGRSPKCEVRSAK